jgi:hypothetical protein
MRHRREINRIAIVLSSFSARAALVLKEFNLLTPWNWTRFLDYRWSIVFARPASEHRDAVLRGDPLPAVQTSRRKGKRGSLATLFQKHARSR